VKLPRSLDHSKITIAFMVGVALLVWGIFIWRANASANANSQLCRGIKALMLPSVARAHIKGTASYKYYKTHPDQLRALDRFVQTLPC
jgi:hypothetical protein